MSVGLKNAERVRLTGEKIKMGFLDVDGNQYSYNVDVDEYLGEGSSCICYEVTVYKNDSDLGQKRVLKQFYPNPKYYEIDTEMTGMHLDIKGYSENLQESQNVEVSRLGKFFENAFKKQIALANNEELADVIVRPDLCYFDGATKYILFESDYGQCLDLKKIKSVEDFINKMYDLAFALQQLHKNKILYIDLRPSNILVSSNGRIKLFDFDASIDMNHIADVHIKNDDIRYDVSNINLIAPELRPGSLGEFEQNKGLILNERIDIYSFGAILFSFFFDRYPGMPDCESAAYKPELFELFNGKFRGELTDKEIELLSEIIWKCIQKNRGSNGRYCYTEDLVKDLKALKDMIGAPIEKRRKEYNYNKMSWRLQSACVMAEYPLSKYRRLCGNEWIMDSLIIGNDPIGEDFLANIFACSQMLNTKHIIRIAVSSAEKKMKEYMEKWPLLSKTTNLFLNNVKVETELDTTITKTPFAELHFYEWDAGMDAAEFVTGLEQSEDISWIVVCDSELEKNKEIAERIADKVSGNEKETFIAYLDDRGDGYDLRKSDKNYENVVLLPFASNDKYSEDEEKFDKGIKKQALLLHKYYMREWNERANRSAVKQDFWSKAYNVHSSLCSVLSIPYKLTSVGIKTTGSDAAAEYKKIVLDKENPKAKIKFNQLIYLEHRRWICFMVTEGYNKPDKKQLEQYAFRGDNDQRNKVDKLHPCICDCGLENGICLDRFPRDAWKNANLGMLEREIGMSLDELDTMSVNFHRLCNRRINQMVESGEFEGAFRKLERAMKIEKCPVSDYELLDSIRIISQRMLNNESNINQLWNKVSDTFTEMIDARSKNSKVHTNEVSSAFKEFKNMMRVVKERNSYHDYKSSDRTILEALPLLLVCESAIRRIHKPVAGKTWQNIASALIIEPEQLYLYTDEPEILELEVMRSFLEKERGIMEGKSIIVKDMNDLRNFKLTKTSVKSVLDITGLSAEETYEITHMENLKELPVIAFKNGQIRSLNGETEADYYSAVRRHVSVAETFRLYHANIHSEGSQNHALGLVSNYENIWKAYLTMNSFRYRILVEVLSKIEEGRYWKLDEQKAGKEVCVFERKRVPHAMLQDSGMDKLIAELLKGKWIENGYVVPGMGQIGTLTVKTKYPDVKKYFEKMFEVMERYPYMHRFVYLKTYREPLTEKPSTEELYYIYDDTLVVDDVIKNEKIDADRNIRDVLEPALKAMDAQKTKQGEAMIIDGCGNGADTCLEDIPGKKADFRMKFIYRNRSTKECLMKEGNILEAYVYHSIWRNAFVDDVKINVAFTWGAETPGEALERGAITNEIDLVCTHNMQTYFISCKQSMPKTEYLQEIKYFADYFGIDGKAILVTSNWGTSSQQDRVDAELVSSRSQKMQVYYIDRGMLGNSIGEMNRGNLSKYIQNIFDGKKDWKNIEN